MTLLFRKLKVAIEESKLLPKPIRATYDLEALLAEVTPDNLHQEIETGHPVGSEVC